MPDKHTDAFDRNIRQLFRDAWRISAKRPAQAAFLLGMIGRQQAAARRRRGWEKKGVHVPPLLIVSITNRCNLACKGCYAQELRRAGEPELDPETFRRLLAEARDLGCSIVMLAGGEPLVRPELIEIAAGTDDIIFPVFTNGTLLDDALLTRLAGWRNIVPVLSIEGYREETDTRRGPGVHELLRSKAERLTAKGVLHGASLTATRHNVATITDERFIEGLVAAGTRVFFFVEYVPVKPGTDGLILTDGQKRLYLARLERFESRFPALFIAFPGDEEQYGGCLAAGRGFVHVSASGRVEPCPFAPWSDASVRETSLRQALGSGLLSRIRENHGELKETRGGCALWQKREWVESLVGRR